MWSPPLNIWFRGMVSPQSHYFSTDSPQTQPLSSPLLSSTLRSPNGMKVVINGPINNCNSLDNTSQQHLHDGGMPLMGWVAYHPLPMFHCRCYSRETTPQTKRNSWRQWKVNTKVTRLWMTNVLNTTKSIYLFLPLTSYFCSKLFSFIKIACAVFVPWWSTVGHLFLPVNYQKHL